MTVSVTPSWFLKFANGAFGGSTYCYDLMVMDKSTQNLKIKGSERNPEDIPGMASCSVFLCQR